MINRVKNKTIIGLKYVWGCGFLKKQQTLKIRL